MLIVKVTMQETDCQRTHSICRSLFNVSGDLIEVRLLENLPRRIKSLIHFDDVVSQRCVFLDVEREKIWAILFANL